MKVLVVGATGAIGPRIVTRLVRSGHDVFGSSRTAEKGARVSALGATPVVLDALDEGSVEGAVSTIAPDTIVHQATALSGPMDFRHFEATFRATNLLRTRGTDLLLAAAKKAGTRRFVAQSYAGWPNARTGASVKNEDDPLDSHPAGAMRETLEAIRHLERAVVEARGIVLRYGGFYGDPTDAAVGLLRRRLFPLIGDGSGVWSFVHLDDAADATVLAVERAEPGIYNIVDDDPAPVREWLPAMAKAVGAKPPLHVPRWIARVAAGEGAVVLMTEARGSSNAKARRVLAWTPQHPSWRQGFPAAYAS